MFISSSSSPPQNRVLHPKGAKPLQGPMKFWSCSQTSFLGRDHGCEKNSPPATLPARGRFIEQDLNRSAKHFGVTLLPVTTFHSSADQLYGNLLIAPFSCRWWNRLISQFYRSRLLQVPANFLSEVAKTSIACQRLLCAAQNSESSLSASQVTALVDSLFEGMHSDAQHRDAANTLKIDADFLLCRAKIAGFDSATSVRIYSRALNR